MKKLLVLIVFIFFIHSIARADFNSGSRGTTTANFLKLGVGARAVAMGEAYSAVADDVTSLYWNPAGLSNIDGQAASFMHAPYLASSYYDYGAYAHQFGAHTLAGGVQYFSAGSLAQTDENNTPLGSFTPYDLAMSLGYAYRMSDEGWALGVAGKFIRSKIIDTASAFAVDAGAQSRWYAGRIRFAFALSNLGSSMKFDQESERLPLAFRYGGAFRITPRWLASLDIVSPRDNGTYTAWGTEYKWHTLRQLQLASRLGYNTRTVGDISGVSGLSLGFGLSWQALAFDYAFLPYGGLGITHRISISLKWGTSKDTPKHLFSAPKDVQLNYPYSTNLALP